MKAGLQHKLVNFMANTNKSAGSSAGSVSRVSSAHSTFSVSASRHCQKLLNKIPNDELCGEIP